MATNESTAIEVRCGGIGVTAERVADGVVRLRYAAAGASAPPSWAVVAALPAAQPMLAAAPARLTADAMTIEIDAQCRVRATLADGTVAIDDAEPFVVGTSAVLSRVSGTDRVYGLGERTGGLNKRGSAWTFWNTDAYDPTIGGWKPGQDPLYQAIPFELHQVSALTFGIFTDATRRMTIDLSGTRDRVAVEGAHTIDQYVIAGPRMANVVDRYTQLTGRPALPPRWALGFHQSRWGYANASEVEAIADKYRALDIPADAIWLDIQHMRGFRSFTFDPQAFADPAAMIARLRSRGFRVITIEDPGIKVDPGWDVYDSGLPHFLDYTGTAWPGASRFPDFSSAATRAWWGEHVKSVLDLGVAGIWLDVNEPTTFPEGGAGTTVPDDVTAAGDGTQTTMAALHNAYALFEARATYDAIAARGSRPFVLSRAGYAGIQRYAAVWTGDTASTWQGLEQTLPMLLGLGVSGVPFVGSDIGGYSGHATPELFARWIALGSISPFARAHVTSGVPGQEPWMFGAEVLRDSRELLRERYRLLPYLYSLADEAARTGAPLLRPLVWDFPEDPAVAEMADEAMLGPSILVAPVVVAGATTRAVYLPAGRWYDYESDAIVNGPATITVALRMASLPMFVRAGAIIPTTDAIEIYPGAASSFTLYEDDGESIAATPTRTQIAIEETPSGLHVTADRALAFRIHRADGASGDGYDPNARTLAITTANADVALTVPTDLTPAVDMPIEVHVPTDTPTDAPLTIATSLNGWTHVPLTWTSPGVARGTITATAGTWLDYKIARGSWDSVEKLGDCGEAPNRTRVASARPRIDVVEAWRDRCP
jgi:alpha-glucosidase